MARFRRTAIAILTLSFLVAGGGSAFAISGQSSPGGDAAQVVYPDSAVEGGVQGGTEAESPGEGGVLGQQEAGGDGSGTRGVEAKGKDGEAGLQPTQQLAAGDGSDGLPFTGMAAIPLLLVGASMLMVGAVLVRRLQHSHL